MKLVDANTIIAYTLGPNVATGLDTTEIVNDAGEWVTGAHEWQWLVRGPAFLNIRGKIDLSGATWTPGTRTLTKVGAFTNYSFLEGDPFEVLGGTGTTVGQVTLVESRTSNDAIVLRNSISATGAANFSARMLLSGIALPPDFREAVSIRSVDQFRRDLQWCDIDDIEDSRQTGIPGSGWPMLIAIARENPVGGGPTVVRIEHEPVEQAAFPGAIILHYRSKWTRVTTETVDLNIPLWFNGLFKEVLRAFARGNEEEDEGTTDERLARIQGGPLWEQCLRQDAFEQPSFGRMQGTLIGRDIVANDDPGPRFSVSDPT